MTISEEMRICAVLIFLYLLSTCRGGEEAFPSLPEGSQSVYQLPYDWVETSTSVGIEDIKKSAWADNFAFKPKPSAGLGKKLWGRISLAGILLDTTETYALVVPAPDQSYFYYSEGDSLLLGYRAPPSDDPRALGLLACTLSREDLRNRYLYFSTSPVYYTKVLGEARLLPVSLYLSERGLMNKIDFQSTELINLIFVGSMLIMIFYSLAAFLMNKKREFLLYSGYLMLLLVYLAPHESYFYEDLFLALDLPFFQTYLFTESIQIVIHTAYLIFIIGFLSAKSDYPILYKVAKATAKVLGLYFLFFIVAVLLEWKIAQPSFLAERLIMGLFTIWASIHVIFNRKDVLAFLASFGSMAFLVGGMLVLFGSDNSYMKLGALVEIFTFSLGLGFKMRKSDLLSLKYNNELIEQLKINEALQRRNNEELQKEVEKRSQELLDQEMALEREKKHNLEMTLKQEVDRVKMIALRAQMNPHFLFNSLNSIRALIIHQRNDDAYKYLTKFSRLIRIILENSEKELISLKQELETLQLYLSLERMRFSDGFEFHLEVDDALPTESLQVPPLILQPFLENAIIHGLAPKEGYKELRVTVSQGESGLLECVVRDNGVGRDFHQEREHHPVKERSMAIELTTQRIALIDTEEGRIVEPVEITDKTGPEKGTEVKINFPVIYE